MSVNSTAKGERARRADWVGEAIHWFHSRREAGSEGSMFSMQTASDSDQVSAYLGKRDSSTHFPTKFRMVTAQLDSVRGCKIY